MTAGILRGREKLDSRLRHWEEVNRQYNEVLHTGPDNQT